MKKLFILTLTISTLFISGCSCSNKAKDPNEENKENEQNNNTTTITDNNVVGQKNVDGILLENTTFHVENDITTIVTKVTNTTAAEFFLNNYQVIVTDSQGQVLTILTSTVQENLAIDESKSYTTSFALDLSTAANVEYKVNVTQ